MPDSSQETPKRPDPRVTRTRELLQNAFLKLLEEKPYERITIADITGAATVNRKTFYLHYETKDHLPSHFFRRLAHAVVQPAVDHSDIG